MENKLYARFINDNGKDMLVQTARLKLLGD